MGLFDYINCEYQLPDGWEPKYRNQFQTKSLFNKMTHYTITKDGQLIEHYKEWEFVPEEERPYYGTEKWNNPIYQCIGMQRIKEGSKKDLKFGYNGWVVFYHSEEPEHKDWHEYSAFFIEGKLQSIEVVNNEVSSL